MPDAEINGEAAEFFGMLDETPAPHLTREIQVAKQKVCKGRFCCKSRLKATANHDSLILMRTAAEVDDDGAARIGALQRATPCNLFVASVDHNKFVSHSACPIRLRHNLYLNAQFPRKQSGTIGAKSLRKP
jgi:hypothetical protein